VLAEIVQDQGVVLWIAEERSNPFEGFKEAGEILVGVFLADFGFREDDAVTSCQCADGRGLYRSLKMKVEFRKTGRIGRVEVADG
jgi:hypothetical protein